MNPSRMKMRGGRLKAGGNVHIEASGLFRNGGGSKVLPKFPETITVHTYNGGLASKVHNNKDAYDLDLENAGVIASDKSLTVSADEIDNQFGLLVATHKLSMRSSSEIKNEYGLIYSNGTTSLDGTLRNGSLKDGEKFLGVNQEVPITISKFSISGLGFICL